MSWITTNQRVWRFAVFISLVLAFSGPWVYDRIHVPAQYPCTPPNIRLEGDFCGLPLTGGWLSLWMVSNVFSSSIGAIKGSLETSAWLRELLISLLFLWPALPLVNTFLLSVKGGSKRLQYLHLCVSILALGLVIWFGFSSAPGQSWRLWGLWLYPVAVMVAILLEGTNLIAERKVNA